MTAKEFLKMQNIIPKDGNDLIVGFDNGTNESLIEILDSYHEIKLKKQLKSFVSYAKSISISDININDDTIDYFIEEFI